MTTWITQPHVTSNGLVTGAWVNLEEAISHTEHMFALQKLRGQAAHLTDEQIAGLPLTVCPTSGRSAHAELSAMTGPRFEPDIRRQATPPRHGETLNLRWEQLTTQGEGRRVKAGALGWPSGAPTRASRLHTVHLQPHWPWGNLRGTPPTQAGLHTWPPAQAGQTRVLLAQGAMRLAVLGPAEPDRRGGDWDSWAEHARRCADFATAVLNDPDAWGTGPLIQMVSQVIPALGPGLALCGLVHLRALLPRPTDADGPYPLEETDAPGRNRRLAELGLNATDLTPQLPRHEWRAGLMATLMAGALLRELTAGLTVNQQNVEVALIAAACGLQETLMSTSVPPQGPLTTALRRLRQDEHLAQIQRHLSGGRTSLVPARQRELFLERREIVRLYEERKADAGNGEVNEAPWTEFKARAAQWWAWSQDTSGLTPLPSCPLPALRDLLTEPGDLALRHSTSTYTLMEPESEQSNPTWLMNTLRELGTGLEGMDIWHRLLMRVPPGQPMPECTLPLHEHRRAALVNLTEHLKGPA